MKRLSKIFLLFITIFSVLVLVGGNDVFAFANQYIAWRKDVNGDGKPDLLFRRYTTATQQQLEKYYKAKGTEYLMSDDGDYIAYTYKGMVLPSKWVHPETAGIYKPSPKEFVTIGYSFHKEQEGEYSTAIEGNTTAAMIAYDDERNVTPITNSIDNVLDYFNSVESIILRPVIWDDEAYIEIEDEDKEEAYKKIMPSLLYETYSNKGGITQTNYGTRWNISTLQPNNKLVYRYAIMDIERVIEGVTDVEHVYIEDRVIYHDELLELRAAMDEAGIETTMYMSDIVISGALYDAGGYELSRTVSQFFSQYKKHGYETEFWPENVIGTAEEATQTAVNLFDNAITLPKKSKRNVIVRHISVGYNSKVTDEILQSSGKYLPAENLSIKVKDDANAEYENVNANAYLEAGGDILWELYLDNIEVYQYMKKSANTYEDGHLPFGYNIVYGDSLEDAIESLDIKLRWDRYTNMPGDNEVELDGLIHESESEWVVIDFYYTKKPDVVYVNHLLVDKDNKVLPLDKQIIRGNSVAYTGKDYNDPISAVFEDFDSLGETEKLITMIQEKYHRHQGQSIMVRTSMHVLDERFNLLKVFEAIRYQGYEILDGYTSPESLVGKKVYPSKDWYKPFDVIKGVILPANKVQVNFYYYNRDKQEATIPNKFVDMKFEFKAQNLQGECTNEAGNKIVSVPSGENVKVGITQLYKVMASAINLEYIAPSQNRHDVDVIMKYSFGNDTYTLKANNVKYNFGYFRVDELVVDAIDKITLFDASPKWASTSGGSIFSWSGDKYEKDFTQDTSVALSAIKTINNSASDIKNWKNYATAQIEDKDGHKSNSDPTKITLSASFLSQKELNTVDLHRDGKVNNADKEFAYFNLNALKATRDTVNSVNQWAVDVYNSKKAQYERALAKYRDALTKSSVLQELLEDAEGELAAARNRLNSYRNSKSSKQTTISNNKTTIKNNNAAVAKLEAEIANIENNILPGLEADKKKLEDEKKVLEDELVTLRGEMSTLEGELKTLQDTAKTLNNELNAIKEAAGALLIERAGLEYNRDQAEKNKDKYCVDSTKEEIIRACSIATQDYNDAIEALNALEVREKANADALAAKNKEIGDNDDAITAKNNEIRLKQNQIDAKNSQISSKNSAISSKQSAIDTQNNIISNKRNSITNYKNSTASLEETNRRLEREIVELESNIRTAEADVSYWQSVMNARENSFNLFYEAELLAREIAKDACWLEMNVREAAKDLAKKLMEEAEEEYQKYKAKVELMEQNYDYCRAAYVKYEELKDIGGVLGLKSNVAAAARHMGIKITFKVSNMLIKLNGTDLISNNRDMVDQETLDLADAMYQTTILEAAAPKFKKQAYDGIGYKVSLSDFGDWKTISKYAPNGLRTLAGEVKYETRVLIKKNFLTTTKSVVDNVYYSNNIDNPGTITDGTFQLDYDGLITKTSREVNIYTPIAASAQFVSNTSKIVDQSTNNLSSRSDVQTIQLGVPFTITFGNKVTTTDKAYPRLTDMSKYKEGYYIKFDFDVCNVKVVRNGEVKQWVDSKGNPRTGTAKKDVIKAGTWIGIIYSGTSSTQITAEVYSDVTDENINVIDELTRRSYTVRAVAYNANANLKTYYADKYETLLDMMKNRSVIKSTVKNICTDKTTTGAENDMPSYYADKTYELVVLNRLYDFRVTDLKDVAWKSVFRENKNSIINAHTGRLYYAGTKKWVITNSDLTKNVSRSAAEIGRNPTRILPIGAYKHTDQTYIKAPKLGYTFSYDMKVTGAYYDEKGDPITDKKVTINTKFYYVSNDGKTFLEEGRNGIYLFYKNAAGQYVRIDNNGGGYKLTFTPNDSYRYITDKEKITLSNDIEELGNLRKIVLTHEMATVYQSYDTATTANNGTIITYYGEYKLPNSTIAVAVDSNGKYDINKPLKNGYIGVVFDIKAVAGKDNNGTNITLAYGENSNGTNTSQWDYEGYLGFTKPGYEAKFSSSSSIRLEDGNWNLNNTIYNKIKGTVILYDVDEKAATDYE